MKSPTSEGAALRLVLTAIVLVNLAFVHATEDASFAWLAPMYAAALASPWLARLTDSAVYRWMWNFAVIGIFLVLVRHTADAGPRFLLEDGLRLAAVCQVHVLCTLGSRQKPDLLFFNSFLIAVVTAFLTQDLPYSVVFLAYAPLFVLGLALYSAGATNAPGAVVRDALPRAALALAATFAVFFAYPRDFHRKGLVVERLTLGPAARALDIGFSDDVQLDRKGGVSSSDAVVLRVHVTGGNAADVPAYWRGATQVSFDGKSWNGASPGGLDDVPWRFTGGRSYVRSPKGGGASMDVDLVDTSSGRVFLPVTAQSLSFTTEGSSELPQRLADGTLSFTKEAVGRANANMTFRVGLDTSRRTTDGVTPSPTPPNLLPAVSLDNCPPLPSIARLAAQLRASLPADAAQHAVVEAFRERLASRSDYLPPGSPDAATDVDAFVRGEGGGHCEHFATALALMLRHVQIPCRLVTGYVGDEWDERTATLTIRRRDAHAWVEVKDPNAGWYAVDPTPNARAAGRGTSIWAACRTWFSDAWDRIVTFDDTARAAVVAWIAALPGRAVDFVRDSPIACSLVVAAIAAIVVVRVRSRARAVPAEVRAYRACLRRLRISARSGETPRDVVARAAVEGLPREAIARLEAATQRHEAARYAATA